MNLAPPGPPMWLTLTLTAIIALFGVIVVSFFTRGTPVEETRWIGEQEDREGVHTQQFRDTFSTLTNTTLHEQNRVEILTNGDGVYPRLFEDLAAARELITWHVFWFKPGELADRLADTLIERARAGVQVLFLYDYFGALGVEDDYFARLEDAGIEVSCFRPLRWNTLYKLQQRMHVRAVVIDGRIGYTGGFAIADEWTGDGRHEDQWRDTSVRLEGRTVPQLQAAFGSNWTEATGQLLVGDRIYPREAGEAAEAGTTEAGLMFAAPNLGSTVAERFFMLSIERSKERLYITNAYFVPDARFRAALVRAVERGVDVRVLTPGRNTDRPSTFYASRAGYEELLEGGVRVYHYRPTMVHAKTLVVDGVWGAVGTVNFDNRSMVLNDEVAVVMQDEERGRELERIFLDDLEYADEVALDDVRGRGRLERIKERFYLTFSPVL